MILIYKVLHVILNAARVDNRCSLLVCFLIEMTQWASSVRRGIEHIFGRPKNDQNCILVAFFRNLGNPKIYNFENRSIKTKVTCRHLLK